MVRDPYFPTRHHQSLHFSRDQSVILIIISRSTSTTNWEGNFGENKLLLITNPRGYVACLGPHGEVKSWRWWEREKERNTKALGFCLTGLRVGVTRFASSLCWTNLNVKAKLKRGGNGVTQVVIYVDQITQGFLKGRFQGYGDLALYLVV